VQKKLFPVPDSSESYADGDDLKTRD
jgi:hypothetical protein